MCKYVIWLRFIGIKSMIHKLKEKMANKILIFASLWDELDSYLDMCILWLIHHYNNVWGSRWIRHAQWCLYYNICMWIALSKFLLIPWLTYNIYISYSFITPWENVRETCLEYWLKSTYYFGVLSNVFKNVVHEN